MDQWLNPYRRAQPLSTQAVADGLAGRVGDWLGQTSFLFQDVLMAKQSGHQPFPWHQDFPFWPVDRPLGLVLWVPLDPITAERGGLHLAVGSHRHGVGPAVDLHTGAPQAGAAGIALLGEKYQVACPTLAPGDAIVFDPLTWHRSPENCSGQPRRVWSSTWLGEGARWFRGRAPRHPLGDQIEDGALVSTFLRRTE